MGLNSFYTSNSRPSKFKELINHRIVVGVFDRRGGRNWLSRTLALQGERVKEEIQSERIIRLWAVHDDWDLTSAR